MSTETQEKNPLELSDEEFLNMNGPAADTQDQSMDTTPAAENGGGEQTPEETGGAETTPANSTENQSTETAPSGDTGKDQVTGGAATDKVESEASGETAPKEGEQVGSTEGEEGSPTGENTPPDYEGFFKKVMTPFKANGKTIELKSPEEAIQLMQMGANYTRKLQELAPSRKVLTMLQNNDLLDESKLSFLIDLDKKNPEAIKKLIKEAGIDPLEIDTASEPAYTEGSHRVTDEEVNFKTTLEDLGSTPEGTETLRAINSRWDQPSKELLWKHPEIMATIHAQREVGIYDRVVAEVDRRETLGSFPPGTTFLQAYKIVGDELTEAKAFEDLREKALGNATTTAGDPPGQRDTAKPVEPVATRVATPKAPVRNDAAASAASATPTTPAKAEVFVNPLAMSDDEFLKKFDGRL